MKHHRSSAAIQSVANRIIGRIHGQQAGPTLIFVAGIHGNEPSGVDALKQLFEHWQSQREDLCGTVYGLAGNLKALSAGVRYIDRDLNRMWTAEKVNSSETSLDVEDVELQELSKVIQHILETETGPFYFFDLHTTSGQTQPFLTVNDSLLNRTYTQQYPLPIVLGIEEFLDGPLLSYINQLGYVAFGFEAGQHQDPEALKNHNAFCQLTLHYTGVLSLSPIALKRLVEQLRPKGNIKAHFYEIVHRYGIPKDKTFSMDPGFENFDAIETLQPLAWTDQERVTSPMSGHIFMPLYQGKGDDGFFVVQAIPERFLRWSATLRKYRTDRLLVLLPGVNWVGENRESLLVDLRIARFFTKKIFHLLGYRSRQNDGDHLRMTNREDRSRTADYKGSPWLDQS